MVERVGSTSDDAQVPDIRTLIQRKIDAGETQSDLARRVPAITDATLSKIRNKPIKSWPDIATIHALADVCGVDVTTIVLSFARTLGLQVERDADPAIMLPELGALSDQGRDAVLSVARAILAAAEGAGALPDDEEIEDGRVGGLHQLRPAARRAPGPKSRDVPRD